MALSGIVLCTVVLKSGLFTDGYVSSTSPYMLPVGTAYSVKMKLENKHMAATVDSCGWVDIDWSFIRNPATPTGE